MGTIRWSPPQPCPGTSADVLRGLGAGSKDVGILNADMWHRRPPRAALTLLGPPWGLAAPSQGRVATGHAHWGSGLAPLSDLGATRSVLDGGLPEWTDRLSPASIQEFSFEEMNIQRSRSVQVLEGREPRGRSAGGPGLALTLRRQVPHAPCWCLLGAKLLRAASVSAQLSTQQAQVKFTP